MHNPIAEINDAADNITSALSNLVNDLNAGKYHRTHTDAHAYTHIYIYMQLPIDSSVHAHL